MKLIRNIDQLIVGETYWINRLDLSYCGPGKCIGQLTKNYKRVKLIANWEGFEILVNNERLADKSVIIYNI